MTCFFLAMLGGFLGWVVGLIVVLIFTIYQENINGPKWYRR